MFDIGAEAHSRPRKISLHKLSKDVVGESIHEGKKFLVLVVFAGAVHPVLGDGDDALHALVDGVKLLICGYVFFGDDDALAEQFDQF